MTSASSLHSELQFFLITIATTGMQALYFLLCLKHIKMGKVATTTRRQINTLKMTIIKNLYLCKYFESTSNFRVLRSLKYDKMHIHSSLLNQDSLVSLTGTVYKEIRNGLALSPCLNKWLEIDLLI